MPAVPSWETQFDLTSPGGNLSFNVPSIQGVYFLDPANCSFNVSVRSTKDNVPQADGSILHTRFLTGVEMQLAIQLWEDVEMVACADGALLAEMLDDLSRSLRALLNAGDNQGRLAWAITGGNERMLDDARLLVYPSYSATLPQTVTVTIDSEFPYAQDLNQTSTAISSGGSQVLDNTGSATYYPVFRVEGPTSAFTITVVSPTRTTQFVYDASLPGAQAIGGSDCAEINTARNTIFLAIGCGAGDDADLAAGVVQLSSEYPVLDVGVNTVSITGADMTVLWAPAWG